MHQQNFNQIQDESDKELFAVDSNKNKDNLNAKEFFANLALLKAVFQLPVFYTYVHARKSLNPFLYYI